MEPRIESQIFEFPRQRLTSMAKIRLQQEESTYQMKSKKQAALNTKLDSLTASLTIGLMNLSKMKRLVEVGLEPTTVELAPT